MGESACWGLCKRRRNPSHGPLSGIVGYDKSVLTEAVRPHPYQVVLFDEVEKAHNNLFNILLQVRDDGRLTAVQGSTVDFSNTIMTSPRTSAASISPPWPTAIGAGGRVA
jgi:midasin (ATPase involved in ribosome maturation)